jgi:hypothetical protein
VREAPKPVDIRPTLATVAPECYVRPMREPEPVGVDEQLPRPDLGRCRTHSCRLGWLYYPRLDPPRYPVHFFFCARCGRRYRAWEWGWTPGSESATR